MGDIANIIAQPWFVLGVIPFAVSFVLIAILRLVGGPVWAYDLAGFAAGFAFLVIVIERLGIPKFPPLEPGLALAVYAGVVGLIIGMLLDFARLRGFWTILTLVLIGILLTWFATGMPLMTAEMKPHLLRGALFLIVWIVFLSRLATRDHEKQTVTIMLMTASLGLAGIGYFTSGLSLMPLGFILAAALLGFLAWNWPKSRFATGASIVLGVGAPVVVLAFTSGLPGQGSIAAPALLGLIFFADGISGRVTERFTRIGPVLEPIVLLWLCLVPVILAVIAAYVAAN